MRKIVTDGTKNSIDTSVLLNDIIDTWGGPARLAMSFKEEFDNAPKGSMMRTRTLEMISRLVQNATSQEITNVVKPGDMDSAELEEQLLKYTRKALAAHGEKEAEGD